MWNDFETIAVLAPDGVYRPAMHREIARRDRHPGQDPHEYVAAHVRRLEALRRAGIAERLPDGAWRVPPDLVAQGQRFDQRRGSRVHVELESTWSIERQVPAIGATWLDREPVTAGHGFGGEVRRALSARGDFLVAHNLATRHGSRLIFARDLQSTLRERELADVARALATSRGHVYRPARSGQTVSGIYRQRLDLASGRFALLDDGQGFSLVPWRPVLASCLGQAVSATIRGDRVSWQVGVIRRQSR